MLELALLLGLGFVALTYTIEVLLPVPMSASFRLPMLLILSVSTSVWMQGPVIDAVPLAAGTFGIAVIVHAFLGALIAWGDAHRVEAMRILGSRRGP